MRKRLNKMWRTCTAMTTIQQKTKQKRVERRQRLSCSYILNLSISALCNLLFSARSFSSANLSLLVKTYCTLGGALLIPMTVLASGRSHVFRPYHGAACRARACTPVFSMCQPSSYPNTLCTRRRSSGCCTSTSPNESGAPTEGSFLSCSCNKK